MFPPSVTRFPPSAAVAPPAPPLMVNGPAPLMPLPPKAYHQSVPGPVLGISSVAARFKAIVPEWVLNGASP